jgi:diguanylate cyclase (GGDEF)-like protein/PAS domain S-box-containing protein
MESIVLDLPTLAIIISISNVIQLAVLYIQYKLNDTYKGIGLWTVGSLLLSLGIISNYFRYDEQLLHYILVISNFLYVFGLAVWWIGTNRFFNYECRPLWLFSFCGVVLLISIFTIFPNPNLSLHRINISIAIAVLSIALSWRFYQVNISGIRSSTLFLAILFLINGIFSLLSSIPFLSNLSTLPGSIHTGVQSITYIVIFITGILWIFGIIIMINQRLVSENMNMLKNQEILFNTSPDSVLITRLKDGNFVKINEGFTNMTGYTEDEVLEKSTLDLDIWAQPTDRKDFVKHLKQNGAIENFEYEFRKKDNTLLSGLLSARVIDYQGEPHIISVIHDITDRKIDEEKFRMLFERSPIGLSMVDNDNGKFLEVNEALLEMTGYTREEFLELTYWDITPEDYDELEAKQMKDILETGFFGPNEKEYFRKDGTRFNVSISGVLVKGPQGQSINWGFIEDITERKKLQCELRRQATTDELTGLFNRRHFYELAQIEFKRSIRNFHPVTIAMFDLDNLKFYNDNFGHNFGDKALITFAEQCNANLREIDIFARHGGDEFVLLLPETGIEEAEIVVERIRKIINQSTIKVDEKEFNLSSSIGLATLEHRNDTLDEVMARADAALYMAKDKGKNCVISKYDSDFRWPVQQ